MPKRILFLKKKKLPFLANPSPIFPTVDAKNSSPADSRGGGSEVREKCMDLSAKINCGESVGRGDGGRESPGLISTKESERHKRQVKRTIIIIIKKIPPAHNNTIYLNWSSYFSYQWYDFAGVPLLILELRGWQLAKGKQTAARRTGRFTKGLSLMGIFFFLALPLNCQTASASEVSSDFL